MIAVHPRDSDSRNQRWSSETASNTQTMWEPLPWHLWMVLHTHNSCLPFSFQVTFWERICFLFTYPFIYLFIFTEDIDENLLFWMKIWTTRNFPSASSSALTTSQSMQPWHYRFIFSKMFVCMQEETMIVTAWWWYTHVPGFSITLGNTTLTLRRVSVYKGLHCLGTV